MAFYLKSSLLCTILLLLLFIGCSTGKNTATTRAFHEFTTRYNVYHNAEQSYQEILEEQLSNFSDTFDTLLPIHPSFSPANKSMPGGPFDGVVEKMSDAIRKHSITAKPRRDPSKKQSPKYREWLRQEEFNSFLSNAWILLGKAHLQNGDLDEAIAVFSYIGRTFRHNPKIVNKASILLLRCYTEQNSLYQARKTADMLRTNNLSTELKPLFVETYTAYLLKSGNYQQAIPLLQQVIRNEKLPLQKKRLRYLLGQLFLHLEKQEEAYRAFEGVHGLSTPLPLSLYATMNQLSLSSGKGKHKHERALRRMKQKATKEQLQYIETALDEWQFKNKQPAMGQIDEQSLSLTVDANSVKKAMEHDSLYQSVYHSFMRGDSNAVKQSSDFFSKRFPQSAWLPKIKHMQALSSSGKIPEDSPPGSSWEHFSHGASNRLSETNFSFQNSPNEAYLLLLTFDKDAVDRNKLLFTTAAFNFSQFRLRTFDLSFVSIGVEEALSIESFRSYDDANQYTQMLLSDSLFTSIHTSELSLFIISEENLNKLYQKGSLSEYRSFAENQPDEVPLFFRSGNNVVTDKIAEGQTVSDKKIVPLETAVSATDRTDMVHPTSAGQSAERMTPEKLRSKLEENTRKAMNMSSRKDEPKERNKRLKERERAREMQIRQREKERKERARKRAEQIKKREQEREQKIKNK